jgi:hypothetical protein
MKHLSPDWSYTNFMSKIAESNRIYSIYEALYFEQLTEPVFDDTDKELFMRKHRHEWRIRD